MKGFICWLGFGQGTKHLITLGLLGEEAAGTQYKIDLVAWW